MLAGISQALAGQQAQYSVNAATEGGRPPVKRILISAEKPSSEGLWWRMLVQKTDGSYLALKVLSDRVPLRDLSQQPLKVRRFIVWFGAGRPLEYIDQVTRRELMPRAGLHELQLIPEVFPPARIEGGFATAGSYLGHPLVRTVVTPGWPSPDFSSPRVLPLRSDLLIGSQVDTRDDRDETVPIDQRKSSPLTREEYAELIGAGANYFSVSGSDLAWLKDEPVFWRGQAVWPDDYYRPNFVPGGMFIDEPGIRFGWDSGIPSDLVDPGEFANALKLRVHAEEASRRVLGFGGVDGLDLGALAPARIPPLPVWETFFWTSYYQMAGGAAGVIYEGRYVHRGYGWSPELLLGHGLEGLTDRQQFDYFNSYLRGAARAHHGYWGVSVYPEGDPGLMVPAFIHAYDEGAERLWFWVDPRLPYTRRLEVLRGLQAHIRTRPRKLSVQASTAIVLPAGYIPKEDGIFGVAPEQLSPGLASYSDIAAAAMFEGILLSRAGVQYDTTFDSPGLKSLGYKQLIYIRDDGRIQYAPARNLAAAPHRLSLAASKSVAPPDVPAPQTLEQARPGLQPLSAAAPQSSEASTEHPTHTIDIADITIDGRLDDWPQDAWIPLEDSGHVFADNWTKELTLVYPEDLAPLPDHTELGFTWDGISPQSRRRYALEGWSSDEVVITSVTPNSPADNAGLREGDILRQINEKKIRWSFEVWGKIDDMRKSRGRPVHLTVQRGGLEFYGGKKDLSARVALAWSPKAPPAPNMPLTFTDPVRMPPIARSPAGPAPGVLYAAADVSDNAQVQTRRGPELWQNDCVQIGLDPTLARSDGYGANGHEFGLALVDGRAVVYRFQGRKGQGLGVIASARARIIRAAGRTIYEAAIPLSEFAPLCPALWPRIGADFVINDSDDPAIGRKQRIELVPLAMTAGKKLAQFASFTFKEPPGPARPDAAIFWDRRSARSRSPWQITIVSSQPVKLWASLTNPDNPSAPAPTSSLAVPGGRTSVSVLTASPPGRYRLTLKVRDQRGTDIARDSLFVYIYP